MPPTSCFNISGRCMHQKVIMRCILLFAACEYHNLLLISSLDQPQTKLINIVGSTCKEAGTKYAKNAIQS